MNGKELKVAENNLTFGVSARMVNVFGVFKYKPNNSLYVIYADVNTKYNFVDYGSSHVKNNSVLSMSCDPSKAEEIIKEYIYKVTNQEELDNFEIISLKEIEQIELISSNKLEIKMEVLNKLVELTIPKKEVATEEKKVKQLKKKSPLKTFLLILIILVIGMFAYIYFIILNQEESIAKTITCTKSYNHNELKSVIVDEEQVFNFNNTDTLESVDINNLYKFQTEDSYLDFINRGLYYRYMPDENTEGGWSQDDEAHTFKIITKDRVDTAYNKPTNYEEVLSYYKNEGYTCQENMKA